MPYKDEKGHFTNKENAGGPCHHEGGGSDSDSTKRKDQIARKIAYGTELTDDDKKFMKDSGMTSESDDDFDMDFDEEFKYVPQTKIEKAVDEYIEKNWDNIDKNKTVGELAYKVSAMIGKPYPQVLDAVGKSIAARNQSDDNFDKIVDKDNSEYFQSEEEYKQKNSGGIKGDLEKAGFDDVEVVDDKTLKFTGPNAQAGWTIKENENAGFDVFDETGKKVIDDFNANTGNIATAMLQREQNPNMLEGLFADENEPDYRNMSIEEMDKAGFNGPHNNIINKLRNSDYDSVEEAMKDADRWNLDNKQRAYVEAYANKVFGEDFDNDWDELNVDALYRPGEDKGPKESKGPANSNAPAGQVLYNSDDEEFLKDMGANLKNTQYGRQETLDEYYERVKDKHAGDMDDWKAFVSTAYAMSPKEVDRYISLKQQRDKKVVDKVNEMRDEFYGIDDKEKEAIINDLDNRDVARDKVQRNASKFADLMKQGKKKEAWDFLNTLSNEEVSLMFEKLGK